MWPSVAHATYRVQREDPWASGEHLDAHLAAPHLIDLASKMGDLLDENGLTVNRVRRIA